MSAAAHRRTIAAATLMRDVIAPILSVNVDLAVSADPTASVATAKEALTASADPIVSV